MSRPPKQPSARRRKLARSRSGRAGTDGGKRGEGGRLPVSTVDAAMTKVDEIAHSAIVHFAAQSTKRVRTILLVEGTNDLTGRPVRVYIRPDDTLVAVETMGQLERK